MVAFVKGQVVGSGARVGGGTGEVLPVRELSFFCIPYSTDDPSLSSTRCRGERVRVGALLERVAPSLGDDVLIIKYIEEYVVTREA